MGVYVVDKLMEETRRLAGEYHRLTGKVLPVSNELSHYDVSTNLNFAPPEKYESGVDLLGAGFWDGKKIQVKSRVIFDESKSRQRVGQLNIEGGWDLVVLVLMNAEYNPQEMYMLAREVLVEMINPQSAGSKRRGVISVAKFKALGELVWTYEQGLLKK